MMDVAFAVEAGLFFLLLLAYLRNLMKSYKDMPERVAVHFDLSGDANGWCSPRAWAFFSVFFLVVIGSMSLLSMRVGGGSGAETNAVATCLLFGIFYSIFRQILKINAGKQDRLSPMELGVWAFGLPAFVVLLSIVMTHLHA
jgi:hypothetical protein